MESTHNQAQRGQGDSLSRRVVHKHFGIEVRASDPLSPFLSCPASLWNQAELDLNFNSITSELYELSKSPHFSSPISCYPRGPSHSRGILARKRPSQRQGLHADSTIPEDKRQLCPRGISGFTCLSFASLLVGCFAVCCFCCLQESLLIS